LTHTLTPVTTHSPLQRYYIPSARELQRIESITRSPIYSKFSEALAGVATIRAYRREAYFTAASDELMELNAYAFVTQRAAAAWLAMRLDFMGLIILTCAGGQHSMKHVSNTMQQSPFTQLIVSFAT
jgi:ATP-binding cassette subfamily C (CFTR/MRP) protein 1